MEKKKIAVFEPPDSYDEIRRLVHGILVKADALDELPTPIGKLFETSRIKECRNLPDPQSSYLSSLTSQARELFQSAMQKIRGIADLRTRVVYIPRQDTDPRILFAQGHELGHQCMAWHNVNRAYQDDDSSLSPSVKLKFEQEANCFSAETIFQGSRFTKRARDYTAEFKSIFALSAKYGSSIQATAWRFIEEQDIPVAALHYYPSNWQIDEFGNSVFTLWKVTASPTFRQLCNDTMAVPTELRTGHPWLAAYPMTTVVDGEESVDCGPNGSIRFIWQSWWNQHALIVLLRRRPFLRIM